MASVLRLPIRFDPVRLQRDLAGVSPASWPSHPVKIHYDEGWGGLALRSGSGRRDDLDPSPRGIHTYRDTPLLDQTPYLREVLASFQCPLTRVRLLRLAVGTVVHEHIDEGFGRDRRQLRVHVPIETNPGVEFYSNGKRVVMAPGECWFLDTTFPHRLANRGQTDRIHLVIDCVVNDWLLSMFPADFATPSLARAVARKLRTLRFMLKDITRACRKRDVSQLKQRARRLADELGMRWLRGRASKMRRSS